MKTRNLGCPAHKTRTRACSGDKNPVFKSRHRRQAENKMQTKMRGISYKGARRWAKGPVDLKVVAVGPYARFVVRAGVL
jgi:hypothetical protein